MTFHSPDDADYRWARRLRRGEERLEPVFDALLARFRGEFGNPLRARHATARHLFVESMSGVDLRALFALPTWEGPIVRADDVFLLFRDFETVAKRDAHAQVAGPELDAFVASLELGDRFWRTNRRSGPPIVFVQTKAQAEELSTASTARRWADLYWPYVKAHDEFGSLRREEITVPVDSRENFEEGYEGNWYYYFK